MYNPLSFIKRIRWPWQGPANVPRHCIFDNRYGCIILQPIPTESLGTSFDLQTMANNCGYKGGLGNWWHIHHSAPAFQGGMAQTCKHSYQSGQENQAKPCKCQTMELWQDKITQQARLQQHAPRR
ncbi:hypothetical protein QUF64_16535 [Anaerolineales bacterium HSG6]|nr:hypothetical protein [Anaerolineales bacterium HSG6]